MYILPNGHFPENLFSRIDTCQNVHLSEWTFPRKPEWTFQCTFGQMYIENLFSRIYTCQIVYLGEMTALRKHFPEITFPRKFIF